MFIMVYLLEGGTFCLHSPPRSHMRRNRPQPLSLLRPRQVEQLGMHQLLPNVSLSAGDTYRGPVSMLRRAFEATESLGSLTVVAGHHGSLAEGGLEVLVLVLGGVRVWVTV